MNMIDIKGNVHSFQSLGALDGPGIRFVLFMQGCNLRCGCCHNPDTWSLNGGSMFTPDEIINKVIRYKEYFGADGGITASGGEPLLQAEFVREVFRLCRKEGINTCLDTSGSIFNDKVKKLLEVTDRVLLDIKYTDEKLYQKHVGCKMQTVFDFLEYLNKISIPVTLRQVIIPSLNDNKENIVSLNEIAAKYPCVDKVELLPFKKICQVKYDNLEIPFSFSRFPEPTSEKMKELNELLR